MKGLFLHSFYNIIGGMKILLGMLGLMGVIIIAFFDSKILVQAYIGILFSSISVSSLTSVRSDIYSKWNRYEVILPVKRSQIIREKYLTFLFWTLISFITTAIFTGAIVIFKGYKYFDLGMGDILTIYSVIVAIVVIIASYYYIGLYLLGIAKCDILLTLSVILSIGTMACVVWLLNIKDVSVESGRLFTLGIAGIIFGLSYKISEVLYQKSEA